MEVGGNPAALPFGCLHRPLQKLHSLLLRALHPSRELPCEWELDHGEEDEGCERDVAELPEDACPAVVDEARPVVLLVAKALSRRRRQAYVHLEQLPELALEPVLRLVEVAHLGGDPVVLELGALLRAHGIASADQPGLVRVHDAAGLVPDLDAHD